MTQTWHQQTAARRAHRLRGRKAHIRSYNYIQTGLMVCGRRDQPVTVEVEHMDNPANNVCGVCAARQRRGLGVSL